MIKRILSCLIAQASVLANDRVRMLVINDIHLSLDYSDIRTTPSDVADYGVTLDSLSAEAQSFLQTIITAFLSEMNEIQREYLQASSLGLIDYSFDEFERLWIDYNQVASQVHQLMDSTSPDILMELTRIDLKLLTKNLCLKWPHVLPDGQCHDDLGFYSIETPLALVKFMLRKI